MYKFKLWSIAAIAIMLFNINYAKAQLPSQDSVYELVFSDDFTGDTLDTDKWGMTFPWNQGDTTILNCSTPPPSQPEHLREKLRASSGWIQHR